MKLTKVSLPPTTYYHEFRLSSGKTLEVKTTAKDYWQLGKPGHINPTNPAGDWLQSYGGNRLPVGTWAEESYGKRLVNDGFGTMPVAKEHIANDEITAVGKTHITDILRDANIRWQ